MYTVWGLQNKKTFEVLGYFKKKYFAEEFNEKAKDKYYVIPIPYLGDNLEQVPTNPTPPLPNHPKPSQFKPKPSKEVIYNDPSSPGYIPTMAGTIILEHNF